MGDFISWVSVSVGVNSRVSVGVSVSVGVGVKFQELPKVLKYNIKCFKGQSMCS